jgi:hypothetical protein
MIVQRRVTRARQRRKVTLQQRINWPKKSVNFISMLGDSGDIRS